MSVLVTGATGYIGSHTCVELLNNGENIVAFDNLYNSKLEAANRVRELTGKDFHFYKIDMLDMAALETLFSKESIDTVIHFAGLKAVGESVQKPLTYYENNVSGTINLLKVMNKFGVKRFVFSSTATVYGEPKIVPIKETQELYTTNPYASTKLMIENILRDTVKANPDMSVVLLRYFNPIGAHESGRIGENPNGIPNNIMPRIIDVARGKMNSLTVFGNDYPTKDGTGVRDYIHVVDLAKGHICALDYVRKNTGIDAFNLGTGNGYSVYEIIAAFEQAIGRPLKNHLMPRRAGDVPVLIADASKAREVFGWKAEYDLERMCADSWRFALANPEGM